MSHRSHIILAGTAGLLLAFCSIASAQSAAATVECKKTETQPECFARLKCKANEELEACQKRLLRCKAGEKLEDCEKRVDNAAQQQNQGSGGQNQGQQGDQRGNDRNADQRNDDQRNNDDRNRDRDRDRDRDRGDRDREREGDNDRGRRERGEDRDRGDDSRSRGRRRARHADGHGFEANKTFGLGLELGEPTGLNGKVFVSHNSAIDFGVGYIYNHYYYGDGLHLYADYLFHIPVASTASFELPFYIGGGLRFWDFHYCDNTGLCTYGGSAFGIRVPLGLSFDFNNAPLDIFVQLVPVLDFVNGDYYNRYYHNREHFGIDGSVGIRFWFK